MSKKKTALVVAFVVIGITALGLAAAVYAKYISSITKTGEATVAKWAFTEKNTDGTVSCDPTRTYTPATLVADRIAPGTVGECQIEISNEDTEVGIEYKVELPSSVTGKPTNLKFYKDSGYTTEMTTSSPITGTMTPDETTKIVSVYWKWEFQDGTTAYDTADTTDGINADTMSIEFKVTGTQLQPVAQ